MGHSNETDKRLIASLKRGRPYVVVLDITTTTTTHTSNRNTVTLF